jgi:hypothetical protein
MALTSSIEAAWLKVNSSKQPELKDLQSLTVCAGQMEQFGINSFALSTICNGMVGRLFLRGFSSWLLASVSCLPAVSLASCLTAYVG